MPNATMTPGLLMPYARLWEAAQAAAKIAKRRTYDITEQAAVIGSLHNAIQSFATTTTTYATQVVRKRPDCKESRSLCSAAFALKASTVTLSPLQSVTAGYLKALREADDTDNGAPRPGRNALIVALQDVAGASKTATSVTTKATKVSREQNAAVIDRLAAIVVYLRQVISYVERDVRIADEGRRARSRRARGRTGDICRTLRDAARWMKTAKRMIERAGRTVGANGQCNEGYIGQSRSLTCGRHGKGHVVHKDIETGKRYLHLPGGRVRMV